MPTEITSGNEVGSKPSYGVTFGKKVSDGNYGGDDFSVWVSADVSIFATADEKYAALLDASNVAKALVYDHFKIEAKLDEEGVMREAVARVERAFPGTKLVDGTGQAAPVANAAAISGVRVKGQQHGELPSWLIEDAAKAGVTEVWDNRDQMSDPANAKKPHFKATTKAPGEQYPKGFWPPKGR